MDREKVVEEYKNGDEAKRLGLFFMYRDLREEFSRIEQECSHDDFSVLKFRWNGKRRTQHAA